MAEYHVKSFGCRASQADGDAISASLEAMGSVPASGFQTADLVIVNTCSVTAEADRDARAYVRRVNRTNPQARVIVTGCYAQRAPEQLAPLPGVFAVIGNSHKAQVASIALDIEQKSTSIGGFVPLSNLQPAPGSVAFPHTGNIFANTDFKMASFPGSGWRRPLEFNGPHRTRPSLKIQDGCGNRCTFCIIPTTRGNSRSQSREDVLRAIKEFIEDGGKELVLSGINLGRWGRDLPSTSRLEDLLTEILETTDLPRLRISSIEPMDWTDGILGLLRRWGTGRHPRMARHIHLPLQSGSDGVLRRMHRRYRPWHYAERLEAVRAASPDAAIGADVMVGFPGESEAEFQESYDFIAAQPFTYLHLFPFSARPGTPGWELHRQSPVAGNLVRERMEALRRLIAKKNRAFHTACIGRELSGLTLVSKETAEARQRTNALTDNFLPIEIEGVWPANTLLTVQVISTQPNGLYGTPVADGLQGVGK